MQKTTSKKTSPKTAAKAEKNLIKRPTRFTADPMTLGYVDYEAGRTFKPQAVGVVLNESYTGCALIMASDNKLKEDMKLKIKVGNLEPVKAILAWIKPLEENIYKIGIKFLE